VAAEPKQKSSAQAKPQLGPYQEGVKRALQKAGEEQAMEALVGGVPPQHIEQKAGLSQAIAQSLPGAQLPGQAAPAPDANQILQQLMSLASTKVEDPGTAKGPFLALADLVRGKGFHPLAPQQTAVGIDTASKVMGIQNDLAAEQRRLGRDMRLAPGDHAKTLSLVLKAATDQAKMTGDYTLLNMLTPLQATGPDGQPAPQNMNVDPAFRAEAGQQNVLRIADARKELDTYTRTVTPVMNDVMKFQDIAEKMKSYKSGLFNQIIARGDTVLDAIAADPEVVRFDSAIDRSLGGLVKFGGDTGNLNEQEQQRAKKAIGAKNIPLASKIQIYNDTLDKVFAGLDVRKEQAQEKDYEKRFPLIGKARERYEKNKEYLAAKETADNTGDLKSRLDAIAKKTGAKITYA